MIYMFKVIPYCWLMYLRTFEICLEIYELGPAHFLIASVLAWQAAYKNTKVTDLVTDICKV